MYFSQLMRIFVGLTRFQQASKQAVSCWLKQGFTLVPENSGFFLADLKYFLCHLLNVFSYYTVINTFFEEEK
jgi:hypothetical protein